MSEIPETMDYWTAQQIVTALSVGEIKGANAERERIIKLLESELGQGNPDFITERDTTIERLIALIKGEN